jgi:nucleotide-binding universal stress UspA family protein
MMMFSRILVPLDGSPESNAALPLARTVAAATSASITLLRVLPSSAPPPDGTEHTEAQDSINRIARELAGSGVQVEAAVRYGDPAKEILQQSRAPGGADLILMRTHGRVGLERAVLGSVAQVVLKSSSVPVLLFRVGGRRISHIRTLLVPVDGSPGGALGLGVATGLARTSGAALKLLEVAIPVPPYLIDTYPVIEGVNPAWDEQVLSAADSYVKGLASRLEANGLAADGEAHQASEVADKIVEVAEKATADLIVMSTHALTGPARAVFGSVADAVVRKSHCPVLLVHRADAADHEEHGRGAYEASARSS